MPHAIEASTANIRCRALVELGERLRDAGYAFVTVTPESHRTVLSREKNARAVTLRDVFGWNRVFDLDLLEAPMRAAMADADVLIETEDGMRSSVRFATYGDDVFVHSAFPTEDVDAVFFGPDTYRFLAFLEREAGRASRVVDIGTGSGVAGIVRSRDAEWASLVDVNPRALAYARVNARLAGAANLAFVTSDVLANVHGEIDLVVANPPFMRDPLGRSYRDGGGGHGENLSVRIVRESLERLSNGGKLLLYSGACIVDGRDVFFEAIAPHLEGMTCVHYEELDPDIFGETLREDAYVDVDRIAAVGLVVTK